MWKDELVTLGDIMDFLEWRRVYRGVQYKIRDFVPEQKVKAPPESTMLPSLRLFSDAGRLYLVSRKRKQLHRLKIKTHTASKLSGCSFGDGRNTNIDVSMEWLSSSHKEFLVHVITPHIDIKIKTREGVLFSLFENGFVKESAVHRDGDRIKSVRV